MGRFEEPWNFQSVTRIRRAGGGASALNHSKAAFEHMVKADGAHMTSHTALVHLVYFRVPGGSPRLARVLASRVVVPCGSRECSG